MQKRKPVVKLLTYKSCGNPDCGCDDSYEIEIPRHPDMSIPICKDGARYLGLKNLKSGLYEVTLKPLKKKGR